MPRPADFGSASGSPDGMEAQRTLAGLAGIGPNLAERITRELRLTSLTELELAAHTGRLESVPGIGPRRARRIAEALHSYFDRAILARPPVLPAPSVAELLMVDHDYRRAARQGLLPRVAPRRFNPSGAAWLPVLRSERGGTEYTAFFSNTANAHHAHKTHEWVIVLAARDGHQSAFTVVSETRGAWRGERVVRGREAECRAYYAGLAA